MTTCHELEQAPATPVSQFPATALREEGIGGILSTPICNPDAVIIVSFGIRLFPVTIISSNRKQVKSKTGIELELEIQQVNIDKNDTEYSP